MRAWLSTTRRGGSRGGGLVLVGDHPLLNEVRDLHSHPGPETQGHRVSYPELGGVTAPEWLEVVSQTDFASSVHLKMSSLIFPFQFLMKDYCQALVQILVPTGPQVK